ncbi:MacB-like core domain-containing protein [Chryseolinea serpens]|uniref:MacB-like core domain-containing protein n=1 Tax=Chryseolinea serpens TaxID=947013 RepID=A0A1M5UMB9_9BACT|nr:ABC transporter permease [Chryseolinea serpens]SHH63988.1 MacB-like core domain-containing protein [Chryseolinea serpens]
MTTQPNDIHPPQWPLRLLRFFLKKQYLEEIEGDMEECFRDNLEQLSPAKARRLYAWEAVKLLRPALLENFEFLRNLTQAAMFKNYFKISMRNMMKSPLSAFINVFGLSAAIGICVFGFAFGRWTYSTDQFHEHKHEVFLATFFADRDGSVQQFGRTPRPLGEMLRHDFAHIKKVCRLDDRNVVVKHDDNVFHERVRFVDPEFLDMFTFPLKWGTPGSLADVNSIVLSEEAAIKYFGETNPIGQNMVVIFGKNVNKAFKVTGVAAKFPVSRSFGFDFLVNFENLKTAEPGYDMQDWKAFVNATFVQLDNPADAALLRQGMEKYRRVQNEAVQKEWAITAFGLEPLATLHETSEDIRDDIAHSSESNYASIVYMAVVALMMLLLACFNYINIAIVSAAKRLKEIGIRKSIGAARSLVIIQFLTENIFITAFALVVGVALGTFLFIPWFEGLFDFSMGFKLNDPQLWIYLPAILLFTGILSGLYPAFYISKFQVVSILKGSVKFGQSNPLTKGLLVFQLILACVLVTGGITFTRNSDFLAKRSWGYEPARVVYAEVPDGAAFEQLNAALLQNPNVVSIAGSTHQLGKRHTTTVLHFPDREYEVDHYAVDANYFETMGLPFEAGRGFHHEEGSDKQAVVVNELMVKNMAWGNPIGETFKIDTVEYAVVGVLKNFHSYSFSRPLRPTIFSVAPKADFHYMSIKAQQGTELQTLKALQGQWAKLFPETPFEGGHQEDVWGFYFQEIGIHGKVWRAFATIAVLLASLGLYGLIKLNVAGRVKEFSIRKVLGAGAKHITMKIADQYVILFAVALALGAPVSYVLMKMVMNMAYAVHMPLDYSNVMIAVVILIFVLLTTVAAQIRKVVKANAVQGLKTE